MLGMVNQFNALGWAQIIPPNVINNGANFNLYGTGFICIGRINNQFINAPVIMEAVAIVNIGFVYRLL